MEHTSREFHGHGKDAGKDEVKWGPDRGPARRAASPPTADAASGNRRRFMRADISPSALKLTLGTEDRDFALVSRCDCNKQDLRQDTVFKAGAAGCANWRLRRNVRGRPQVPVPSLSFTCLHFQSA